MMVEPDAVLPLRKGDYDAASTTVIKQSHSTLYGSVRLHATKTLSFVLRLSEHPSGLPAITLGGWRAPLANVSSWNTKRLLH
jgi:hypothetical protein